MQRLFHMFDTLTANGDYAVGLLENGIPKAMAIISKEVYPPHSTQEAMQFSIAVINAFGQKFPVESDNEERPWA